jgi:hypothetical protein
VCCGHVVLEFDQVLIEPFIFSSCPRRRASNFGSLNV